MANQTLNQDEWVDKFLDLVGELSLSLSINPLVGRLYAYLYLNPEPVSLDQIAERMKISKGNASINIRILEDWHAVRRVWVQGSRKDFYVAEPEIAQIVVARVRDGLIRRIERFNTELQHILVNLDNGTGTSNLSKPHRDLYKKRLKKINQLCISGLKIAQIIPQGNVVNKLDKLLKFI